MQINAENKDCNLIETNHNKRLTVNSLFIFD